MNVWDDLNKNIKSSSKQWLSWAKQHAREIGDAGIRHIERQDLLAERRQLVRRLGEEVVNRFIVEDKKTLRADTADIAEVLDRIRTIDERLVELAKTDEAEGTPPPEKTED